MHQFKATILLYQSSLERKNFVKLKKTQLFHIVIMLEALCCTKDLFEIEMKKLREVSVSYFFVLIIALNVIENSQGGTFVFK